MTTAAAVHMQRAPSCTQATNVNAMQVTSGTESHARVSINNQGRQMFVEDLIFCSCAILYFCYRTSDLPGTGAHRTMGIRYPRESHGNGSSFWATNVNRNGIGNKITFKRTPSLGATIAITSHLQYQAVARPRQKYIRDWVGPLGTRAKTPRGHFINHSCCHTR